MNIKILRRDGSCVEVLLLNNKNEVTYTFVNLTKGHICPCKFNSVAEALADILEYDENIYFELDGIQYSKTILETFDKV